METVKLVSSDEVIVEAPMSAARRLGVVKRFMEESMDGDDLPIIPLPNVQAGVLKKVLEYYEGVPAKADPEGDPNAPVDPKDAYDTEFFRIEKAELFALVVAANYLDASELLDGGCQAIAVIVKGLSPQQIRQEFGITEEFTEEELEAARKENAWAFD